jgi:hypothetical protein
MDMKIGRKTKRKGRDEKSIVMITISLEYGFFRRLRRLVLYTKSENRKIEVIVIIA